LAGRPSRWALAHILVIIMFQLITTVTQGDTDISYGLQFFRRHFREKIYHTQLSQIGIRMTLNIQQLVKNQCECSIVISHTIVNLLMVQEWLIALRIPCKENAEVLD